MSKAKKIAARDEKKEATETHDNDKNDKDNDDEDDGKPQPITYIPLLICGVKTLSKFNPKTGEYKQERRKGPKNKLAGKMDLKILKLLLKINEYVLRHVLNIDCVEHNAKIHQILDQFEEIFKKQFPQLYEEDIITKIFKSRSTILTNLDSMMKDMKKIYTTYANEKFIPKPNVYLNFKNTNNYNGMVNFLFYAHRLNYPSDVQFLAGIICQMLFILFLETDKPNESEMYHIAGSELQRRIYDDEAYFSMLRAINDKNGWQFHTEKDTVDTLEQKIFKHIRNMRVVTEAYPALRLYKSMCKDKSKFIPYLNNFYAHFSSNHHHLNNHFKLDTVTSHVFPYIFGTEMLDKYERKAQYVRHYNANLSKLVQRTNVNNANISDEEFQELFDFIKFPNKDIADWEHKIKGFVVNNNGFDREPNLFKKFINHIIITNGPLLSSISTHPHTQEIIDRIKNWKKTT